MAIKHNEHMCGIFRAIGHDTNSIVSSNLLDTLPGNQLRYFIALDYAPSVKADAVDACPLSMILKRMER